MSLRGLGGGLDLRTRLLLAALVPLVLLGGLGVGLAVTQMQATALEQALEREAVQARVAAAGLNGSLKGYVRLLQATAAELSRFDGDDVRQASSLYERSAILSAFSGGVLLLGPTGQVVGTTPAGQASSGMNLAFRSYFQAVRGTAAPVLSSAFADVRSGEGLVVVAVPVLIGQQVRGVLVGQFLLERNQWVRELNLMTPPAGGAIYLMDRAGNIIYHSQPDLIATSVAADTVLMSRAGQATSFRHRSWDNDRELLVGQAPVGDTTWQVVVEEPWAAVAAPINRYVRLVSLVGLSCMVAAAALITLATRRVTRPMEALVGQVQRFMRGEQWQPVAEEGGPDTRALIHAIDGMVRQLDEQRADIRRFARRVVQSQEEERLRLSRDLHDQTVQDLVALNQRVELLREHAPAQPAATPGLDEVQQLLRRSIDEVRRLSNNLRPHALEDLGLVAALEALIRDLGHLAPGVRGGLDVAGQPVPMTPDQELTLYRIAQEALTNVGKHAHGATRADLGLVFEPGGVVLVVEDDGDGFDVSASAAAGHLGLAGMEERAQLMGGSLRLESAPGEGTTVWVRLPLEIPPSA